MVSETCRSCSHPADYKYMHGPGRFDGFICDCCTKKMWEETLASVTQGLENLIVRCEAQNDPA